MRKITHHATVLVASIVLGCASADAEKRAEVDHAAEQLPQPVLQAATDAVPGLEVTDGKRLAKRKEVVYRLKGADADGKEYTLTVTESGQVRQVNASKKKAPKPEVAETNDSPFRKIGLIAYKPIRESSGVVASRRQPGVLWTHNDKGNAPELYAIAKEGKLLARYTLSAVNDDWEDIDTDDQGRLYVGRIGNNEAKGSGPIEVLRVAEPDVAQSASASRRTLPIDRTWRLRYPAKPFDCESLFVLGAHGYLISKHLDGAAASLYRFDLDGPAEQTLTKMIELPVHTPVTGASVSNDGTKLAVLTYGTLYLFEHGGELARIGDIKPVATPTPSGKLEGVCFTPEGILLTAESRQIYLLGEQQPTSTVSIDNAAAQ